MAICFVMDSPVSAGWPDSARAERKPESMVAASAYIGRRRLTNSVTGKTHDFRRGHGRVLYRAVMLPEGAHESFRQPGRLWSAAERAELVFDRKLKRWRFRM